MIKLENIFELKLLNCLEKFVEENYFYCINIKHDIITLRKFDLEKAELNGMLQFDIEDLINNKYVNKKQEAIKLIYMYAFYKGHELHNRIESAELTTKNGNFKHSFSGAYYIDETGKYPEYNIALSIKYTNPEIYEEINKVSYRR